MKSYRERGLIYLLVYSPDGYSGLNWAVSKQEPPEISYRCRGPEMSHFCKKLDRKRSSWNTNWSPQPRLWIRVRGPVYYSMARLQLQF